MEHMELDKQMAAMSAIFVNLVQKTQAPVTNSTGGTSVGNSAAGSSSTTTLDAVKPPSTGDRVGAGMVTTVVKDEVEETAENQGNGVEELMFIFSLFYEGRYERTWIWCLSVDE
ncbi:hypothetical protein EYC84_001352 [Monilinia fructicola]|uniref:Uncharacterized protein n=1 Tax=Monilinia fructicola TaxID=38448 RepID=A0A5M9JKF8_MONFR|nr:hypothetical protein EYC84_001352 [Monilinia fructicola]